MSASDGAADQHRELGESMDQNSACTKDGSTTEKGQPYEKVTEEKRETAMKRKVLEDQQELLQLEMYAQIDKDKADVHRKWAWESGGCQLCM